ncbi:hypothetical protein LSAT2_013589 [Lamellibrachia satsuma]|nr:hypothetical protein LSAT2_013589 [Lamellibrachia satsuma]
MVQSSAGGNAARLTDEPCYSNIQRAQRVNLVSTEVHNCLTRDGGEKRKNLVPRQAITISRSLRSCCCHRSDTALAVDRLIVTKNNDVMLRQLSVLLQRLRESRVVPSATLRRLEEIETRANVVSGAATPYIQSSQPDYYARIGAIIDPGFWTMDHKSRDVMKGLVRKPTLNDKATMHESDSDDCLTELLGTSGNTKQTCRISRHCWDLMTAPGYSDYPLSHEVFYLEIGEEFGCFRGRFLAVTDSLNAGFCANMHEEATRIAAAGYPQNRQDIFMEHQALCGMLGYRQFAREDWLQKILSWQRPSEGCWSVSHYAETHASRFKREERLLPDGCGCHRTAVALGALVQYVRYIIEDGLPQLV